MYVQMHVHKIFSLRITIKAACAISKRDDRNDSLMNTLAFVNFLIVKIFPNTESSIFSTV